MLDSFRQLVQLAPVALAKLDPDSRFLFAEGRLLRDLGLDPETLVGQRAVDLFVGLTFYDAAGSAMDVQLLLERLRAGGGCVLTHQMGPRWIETRYETILDANGALKEILSVSTDVTEMNTLRAERQRFFTMTRDLLCIAGMDGYFKMVNPAFERVLGYQLDELLLRKFIEFVHPDDVEVTRAEMHKLAAGATTLNFENRYISKTGDVRWLSWTAVPDLELKVLYSSARDVTELKVLQDQFLQAQKMEAVGQLAGGIAHDFNNLLTVILGGVETALERVRHDSELCLELNDALTACNKAGGLTRKLLAFSSKQVVQPKIVDVNAIVHEAEKMLRRMIGENIALTLQLEDAVPRVRIDPTQLEQLLLNLVVNARDAMPEGGRLHILTRTATLDPEYARIHNTRPGLYAMLVVSDSGVGMDAATRKRIFEPFFTTKGPGQGTGLGLATVFGIVQQSAGFVWVYSEPGQGATFKIYLPASNELQAPQLDSPTTSAPGRQESILVVEDDETVRSLIRRVLQRAGYRTLEAQTGSDALALAQDAARPIHLVLTDVVMPGMNGRELAEKLRQRRPEVPVIYMSGYTEDVILRRGLMAADFDFIEKPILTPKLLQKVGEVLDRLR